MPEGRPRSGTFVVVGIVLLGVILGLLALKLRISPQRRPTTVPSTVPIAQDAVDPPAQR